MRAGILRWGECRIFLFKLLEYRPRAIFAAIVDDDDFMRSAMRRLFASNGIATEIYASGMEFLTGAPFERGGCVILDVRMPGLNGLEVQAQLKQRRIELPVIFLTASADVPIAVSAMREGAVDFLEKPFENEDLLARVRNAIERHRNQRRGSVEREEVQRRLASLTAREREVLEGRFGLHQREPETLEVLSDRLGLTRERVRQIQNEALSKLKRQMARSGIDREALF